MLSRTLIRYVLLGALRDKFIVSMIVLVGVGISLSLFIGSSAIIESNQFALVFSAGGLRFAAAMGLILFVVFYVRRAFDTKDIEFLLARPLSRVTFLLSHAAAFSLLAILTGLLVFLPILFLAPQHSGTTFLWGISLIMELVIVANAALFFSMVLGSAVGGVLATFGLYILSRLMGEILGVLSSSQPLPFYDVLAFVMKTVSLVVPRLDLMAQTSWLVYDASTVGLVYIVTQGVIYSTLLVAAALLDLNRRQF